MPDIPYMRETFPMMVDMLKLAHVHEHLRIQGKVINWDAINEIERACGFPETPCPDSAVTLRLGLKPKS
jgi:hypothetical protein